MNRRKQLARMERLAGIDSCPLCRLNRNEAWPDPSRPQSGPFLVMACDLCDQERRIIAPSDEELCTLFRLIGRPLEDSYTDPHAWAARKWLAAYEEGESALKRFERHSERAESQSPYGVKRSPKKKRGVGLRRKLRDEVNAALKRKHDRLQRHHGENPFPELAARLEAASGRNFEGAYRDEPFAWALDFRRLREQKAMTDAWARCAEAERIIFGKVGVVHEAVLEECEQCASTLVEEARRKHEEREAKWEREYGAKNRSSRQEIPGREASPPAVAATASPEPQVEDAPEGDSAPPGLSDEELAILLGEEPPVRAVSPETKATPSLKRQVRLAEVDLVELLPPPAPVFDDGPPSTGFFRGPIRRPPRSSSHR